MKKEFLEILNGQESIPFPDGDIEFDSLVNCKFYLQGYKDGFKKALEMLTDPEPAQDEKDFIENLTYLIVLAAGVDLDCIGLQIIKSNDVSMGSLSRSDKSKKISYAGELSKLLMQSISMLER